MRSRSCRRLARATLDHADKVDRLLGYGIVPANPGNPQKSSTWRAKHASKAKLGGPLLISLGLFLTGRSVWGGW